MNKLFEWVDGPLVNAMKKGSVFLADEISLADDSVLERLNSLLGLYAINVCVTFYAILNFRAGKNVVDSRKRCRSK